MPEPVIRVLLVDDEPLTRAAIRRILHPAPGVEVIGEASDGVAAVAAFERLRPDVTLMDLQMGPSPGVKAIEEICSAYPTARVLALTAFGTRECIVSALRAGASGYLLKDVRPEQLVNGIRQALQGDMPLSAAVRRELVDALVSAPAPRPPSARLAPRERELLEWLTHGLTNRQIGRNMGLSEGSVKQYVSQVAEKLGVNSRTQILIKAIQMGMVDPHNPVPLKG